MAKNTELRQIKTNIYILFKRKNPNLHMGDCIF